MTVLWYVHHHGTGHWRRGIAVAARLRQPVTFVSSCPPPWPLPDTSRYVGLPPDTQGAAVGANAGGRLHWSPLGQPGLLARHRLILEEASRASRAVVDVSVEVAVLLRVSGVPVTLVQLPGDRADAPHQLARDLADSVVMPVPLAWELAPPGVTPLGLVSMLAGPPAPPDPLGPVVVVAGAGGGGLPAGSLAALVASRETVLADGAAEIGPLLRRASVVVGGAGLGTVADVATAARPFVVIPAQRPFGEQAATAAACARHDSATLVTDPPTSAQEWRDILEKTIAAGPFWPDADGAARFAEHLGES